MSSFISAPIISNTVPSVLPYCTGNIDAVTRMPPLLETGTPTFLSQPLPSASTYATITLENAEARILNMMVEILHRERVHYKLDVY
jgi:hypothetical protein